MNGGDGKDLSDCNSIVRGAEDSYQREDLIIRFCLYDFGFQAGILLVPIWCGKD